MKIRMRLAAFSAVIGVGGLSCDGGSLSPNAQAAQACRDMIGAIVGTVARCNLSTLATSNPTLYSSQVERLMPGGSCNTFTNLRDSASFYGTCLPYVRALPCSAVSGGATSLNESTIDPSCRGQLQITSPSPSPVPAPSGGSTNTGIRLTWTINGAAASTSNCPIGSSIRVRGVGTSGEAARETCGSVTGTSCTAGSQVIQCLSGTATILSWAPGNWNIIVDLLSQTDTYGSRPLGTAMLRNKTVTYDRVTDIGAASINTH